MIDIEAFAHTKTELLAQRQLDRIIDPVLILEDTNPENGPHTTFTDLLSEVARGEPHMQMGRPGHRFMDVDDYLSPRIPK